MLNKCPAVCLKTRNSAANVFVDLNNLLHGARLQQCARHSLLHAEYNALARLNSDGCAAKFNGLEGVFDLEETAFGREGAGYLLERGNCVVNDGTYLMPRSISHPLARILKDLRCHG